MGDRREFLELAHNFEPKKHSIGGWLMSVKLDGHRAFWDGGLTRGMCPEDVPWANTAKDARYIERPKATGLWSRGGKTIQAPEWFLDALPKGVTLDGELWAGRGRFQYVSSTVKQLYPVDADWKNIRFMVFDSPSFFALTKVGRINTPNWTKDISEDAWSFICKIKECLPNSFGYDIAIGEVSAVYTDNVAWSILPQEKLPASRAGAITRIEERLTQCEVDGDEGLILRHPNMPWEPKRTNNLLKVKRRYDAEAIVVGYTWGRKTDRGSKLLGKMGAMILKTIKSEKIAEGKIFEIAGFDDSERVMQIKPLCSITPYDQQEPYTHPGEKVSDYWYNPKFPIGKILTYKYRELTDDGIPKEAQFDRERIEL